MAPAEQSVPGWLNCVFNKTMMSNWPFVATPVWLGADCLLCIAGQAGENTLINHCLNCIPITRPPVHLSEGPGCPALCAFISPKSHHREVSCICMKLPVWEHTCRYMLRHTLVYRISRTPKHGESDTVEIHYEPLMTSWSPKECWVIWFSWSMNQSKHASILFFFFFWECENNCVGALISQPVSEHILWADSRDKPISLLLAFAPNSLWLIGQSTEACRGVRAQTHNTYKSTSVTLGTTAPDRWKSPTIPNLTAPCLKKLPYNQSCVCVCVCAHVDAATLLEVSEIWSQKEMKPKCVVIHFSFAVDYLDYQVILV